MAGLFVVARLCGGRVGCGTLKRQITTMSQIKRMWSARSARRQWVARQVPRALEGIARARALSTFRFETNRALTEAQALYPQRGYREVKPFNDEPYAHHWFGKSL